MMITNTDNEHLIFENSVAQMEFKPKFFQNSVVHHLCRLSSLVETWGGSQGKQHHSLHMRTLIKAWELYQTGNSDIFVRIEGISSKLTFRKNRSPPSDFEPATLRSVVHDFSIAPSPQLVC